MIGHRCKNCLWWDNEHARVDYVPAVDGIVSPGICRKHKPGAYSVNKFLIGVQPITDLDDFCGEFREDKKE